MVNLARAVCKRTLLALAVFSVTSCAQLPQKPAGQTWRDRPSGSDEIFHQRYQAMMASGGRADYDILAPVNGAKLIRTPQSNPRQQQISPEALESARQYAAATNSSALIVWRNGEMLSEHYFGGIASDDLLPSKSLSKPLTAIAIGRAIQLGKIRSLDQPVSHFVQEWKSTDKADMTIRHMLAMETGLLEQSFAMEADNHWNRAYLDPYHERYIIDEYPLTSEPGSKYSYSNAAGDLVAIVIERATGQRYDRFVGEEILQPIGAAGGNIWFNRNDGTPHSGCCMNLPARSWLQLAILLANDGTVDGRAILPPGFVSEMRRPGAHNIHYGLGVWLGTPYAERRGFMGPDSPAAKIWHSRPYLADDLFLFDGNGNQTVYIIPSQNMVILRMGNSPDKPVEWDNSLLPNLLLSGLKN
ncbi:conserved exported hypothetical protein [Sphingorhabdus sp. 109]|jgi:CubicO group peptidase (beta-lactamase class C family)|nr:conserved exported hypothetical protein [Sphingorhabdus sp. 109]